MTDLRFEQLTVVIPSFKAETTICRTLDSLKRYIDKGLSVIVVEDGIYDNTSSVVATYNVRILQKKNNLGASAARNSGLGLVKTDYVMFLDSDDWLGEGFLDAMMNKIVTSNADICIGVVTKITTSQRILSKFIPSMTETADEAILRCLLGNTGPGTTGIVWRTKFIRNTGGWKNDVRRNDDGEMFIRALCNDPIVVTNKHGTGYYQISNAGSLSKDYRDDYLKAERYILEHIESRQSSIEKSDGLASAHNFFCWKTAMLARLYKSQDLDFWRSKLSMIGSPIFISDGLRTSFKYPAIVYNYYGFSASFFLFKILQSISITSRNIKVSVF